MLTTKERLMKVETQVTELKTDLKQHSIDQREDFDKIFQKLDEMQNSFAGKWVEKIVIGLIILIVGTVTVFALTGGI